MDAPDAASPAVLDLRHRSSVPQNLVGLLLEARITAHAVELLHRGQRVAAHQRSAHKGGFTTVVAHLPAAHRAHLEWTPERLVHWGQSIGAATGRLVTRLIEERRKAIALRFPELSAEQIDEASSLLRSIVNAHLRVLNRQERGSNWATNR